MRTTAKNLVDQFELATTLVVVFPTLAKSPKAMAASVAGFLGSKVIVINDENAPTSILPAVLKRNLRLQSEHAEIFTMASEMFGYHRGLVPPVSLAVQLVSVAGLSAKRDRLLLTGCYRGSHTGSIDMLAEALAAIRFTVDIDHGVRLRQSQ